MKSEVHSDQTVRSSGKALTGPVAVRLLAAMVLLSALPAAGQAPDAVGQPLELRGATADGRAFDAASPTGRVVFAVFLNAADPAAMPNHQHLSLELPFWRRAYRDFHAKGLEIVFVCGPAVRPVLARFLLEYPVPWPVLFGRDAGPERDALQRYDPGRDSPSLLTERNGRVVAVNPDPRELRQRLAELLGPAVPRPIVSAAPERATRINDMADRIIETGQRWVGQGTQRPAPTLDPLPPAATPGRWAKPARRQLSDAALYERALESVFVVGTLYRTPGEREWHAWASTAFAVAPNGILCTSAHVFDSAGCEIGAVLVFNAQGEAFPVERVLAVDLPGDTCLFQTPLRGLRPLPLARETPVGARVRIVSHPGSSVFVLTAGLMAAYELDDQDVGWAVVTAEFGEGSSGAPVMDECGNVVGQVSRTSTLFAAGSGGEARRPLACGPGRSTLVGGPGEPQMTFRYCTPAARLRTLLVP